MNIKTVLILVLVSAFVVLAEEKAASEDKIVEEKKPPQRQCKLESKKITESELDQCKKERTRAYKSITATIETCVDEAKANAHSGKPQSSNPKDCIAKCVLDAEVSLENGLVTPANVEKAVKQRVTGVLQKQILRKLNSCLEKYGDDVRPDDVFCGGYYRLADCMQIEVTNMCYDEDAVKAAKTKKDEL